MTTKKSKSTTSVNLAKPKDLGAAARGAPPEGAAPPPDVLTEAEAERLRKTARQTRLSNNFVNVVAVLMRDPKFRQLRLADLEWLVIPPLLADQCRFVQSTSAAAGGPNKEDVTLVPMAVALWARVSPEVDARLSADLDKPLLLHANEWTSGDQLWLIALAGDPRAVPTFLQQLIGREFKDKVVKLRDRGPDGQTVVKELSDYRPRAADAPTSGPH